MEVLELGKGGDTEAEGFVGIVKGCRGDGKPAIRKFSKDIYQHELFTDLEDEGSFGVVVAEAASWFAIEGQSPSSPSVAAGDEVPEVKNFRTAFVEQTYSVLDISVDCSDPRYFVAKPEIAWDPSC